MDTLQNSSGAIWTCNICSQPFKDIFTLPCQHRFCEKCLHVWVGVYTDTYRPGHEQFPCRVCWQINYIPKTGLGAYHQNFDIWQLQQDLTNLNMQTDNTAVNSTGVLSNAQLATANRTAENASVQQLLEVQDMCSNNMRTSNSAPEFSVTSMAGDNVNGMDLGDTTDSFDNSISNTVDVTSQTYADNRLTNMPIADCDHMIHTKLCFPASCRMYHHM